MAERTLPPYRVYPCEGGWRISSPRTRKNPYEAKRRKVYPTVWAALDWLRINMALPGRDIGWMCQPERTD